MPIALVLGALVSWAVFMTKETPDDLPAEVLPENAGIKKKKRGKKK